MDPLPPHAHDAEPTRDARLVAIETRQKLRDEHVDRRFDAIGTEFAALDRRVSTQISGLDQKIEMGFRALSDELKAERNNGDNKMAKLYEDWRSERDSESKRPASVKVSLLLSLVGVVFPTLATASAVILLLVNPIKESLMDHIQNGPHWDGESQVALLNERTAQHQERVARQLEDFAKATTAKEEELHSSIDKLQEQRVIDAEKWGRARANEENLRDTLDELRKQSPR